MEQFASSQQPLFLEIYDYIAVQGLPGISLLNVVHPSRMARLEAYRSPGPN